MSNQAELTQSQEEIKEEVEKEAKKHRILIDSLFHSSVILLSVFGPYLYFASQQPIASYFSKLLGFSPLNTAMIHFAILAGGVGVSIALIKTFPMRLRSATAAYAKERTCSNCRSEYAFSRSEPIETIIAAVPRQTQTSAGISSGSRQGTRITTNSWTEQTIRVDTNFDCVVCNHRVVETANKTRKVNHSSNYVDHY